MKTSYWLLLAIALCVGVVITATTLNRRAAKEPIKGPEIVDSTVDRKRLIDRPSLSEALGVSDEEMVKVGGIQRPKRDLVEPKIDFDGERAKYLASLPDIGTSPEIKAEANPSVASLIKEVEGNIGAHAAKSLLVAAEPFDREAFLKDKDSYLEQVRPARVFQSLEAGKDVEPIASESPMYAEILQGESFILEVKAEAGMPVSFHTQQLGSFAENQLKTISVVASEDGIAKATYKATPGVNGLVRVLAASPVHSGRLRYMINVSMPQ